MNQADRFLQFMQERDRRVIQDLLVSVRIDEDAVVVTERWIDQSARMKLSSPAPSSTPSE